MTSMPHKLAGNKQAQYILRKKNSYTHCLHNCVNDERTQTKDQEINTFIYLKKKKKREKVGSVKKRNKTVKRTHDTGVWPTITSHTSIHTSHKTLT